MNTVLLEKYHKASETALEEFLKDNFQNCLEEKKSCPTTWKLHYAVKDMMESICYSGEILAHHGAEIAAEQHDPWHEALNTANMKWIVYLRLKDEVQDAHMDIEAAKVAKTHGKAAVAAEMQAMAKTRIANAEKLNAQYLGLPYTRGTASEQAEWDKEYAHTISKHKENAATAV